MSKIRTYNLIISIAALLFFASGCATQTAYYKLDQSLQKDVRNFGGVQYIPLDRLCDLYGLERKWDPIARTAAIQKKSDRIVLMADSSMFLINGEEGHLERPAILNGGIFFVPVSFVRKNLGPIACAVTPERPAEEAPMKRFTIRTIVIDAGHGGKDGGATGRRIRVKEKEKALYLAKRLKSILESSGIRVVMTRDDDTFVPLPKRAEIANRSGADLFVSVHLNSSRSRAMRGFECYYLSNATDDNARALEAVENASLKPGDTANLEHSRQLDKTLWDMTLTENRTESAELANYICESVDKNIAMADRGTRSARFYVLKYTRMPSILVEAGYLSNKYEEMKLKDEAFLDRIAGAVADGILKYKKEYERTEGFTRR